MMLIVDDEMIQIVATKVDHDASFVEVDKSFYKNNGKVSDTEVHHVFLYYLLC